MISAALMIKITIPPDVEVGENCILITREDAETLRNALAAVLGPPKCSPKWTDLPAQLEAVGKVLEDIAVPDEDDEFLSRLPAPSIEFPIVDEVRPFAEVHAEESVLPLADELPKVECARCGGLFPSWLLTLNGVCQPCAIKIRDDFALGTPDPKTWTAGGEAIKAGPNLVPERTQIEEAATVDEPEKVVEPGPKTNPPAVDVPRNRSGETLTELVLRLYHQYSAKDLGRSVLGKIIAHTTKSPIANHLDTPKLVELLEANGITVPPPQRGKISPQKPPSSEPVAEGPAAPVSEPVASNNGQVQKPPEIDLRSNDHQIMLTGPHLGDDELARRQHEKVRASLVDLLMSAPERIAGHAPHITIQVIHEITDGSSCAYISKTLRISEEAVATYWASHLEWLADYAALAPFQRQELDRSLMERWTKKVKA